MPAEISGPVFTLDVGTDPDKGIVRLRLTDEHGRQLGANQVVLAEHSPALWQGLFDTRSYVETYADSIRFTDHPASAAELLEQIGVFLGQKVLGPEITSALHAGIHHRSLVVRQPLVPEDDLAPAFARVPWEIARPEPGQQAFFERNLVVRMELPGASPVYAPPPSPDESLRVLLVFGEAPGSRPLAMRLEREQLLSLFYDEVMPGRRVSVDVLCHGVTRKALEEKVRSAAGYHVVHWSGHGHNNLLELLGEDDQPPFLSGADLVNLFADAGGFIPQLFFLSSCLSGTLVGVRDWQALEAALHGEAAGTPKVEPERVEQLIAKQPGYTGTALALLDAGVPQVVAMRYEVGDGYARDLASLFYRRLLADSTHKAPASALAVARKELLKRQASEHDEVDHATPLLFGRAVGPLPLPDGRSPALAFRRPRPQPLLTDSHELDRPAELVGRGGPLSRLRECLEEGHPAVALVQGLAGLGKTALVAEAIHLWHRRFDGVFAFQSKPLPLSLDDVLRRLDERLALHSRAYRELCEQSPNAAIYLPAGKPLSGDARWRQMRDNLLEAMRSERLLLVLDNFETHLERVAGADGYACEDPEWDRLLRHLADGLPGSGSRLIVTSRHRLAAFADPERALWLPLGPLPMSEAMLFLQGSEALRRLAYGDEAGRKLALRLLEVSRGHPLILTKLGSLASDQEALSEALAELEIKGLDCLPDVFAPHFSEAERERECVYLEDVAIGALDLLIQRASPPARRLLWLVTLATEPVPEELIQEVWPERLAGPFLSELTDAGLLTVEESVYRFHELVRERTDAWMAAHPQEKGELTEEQVWVAYGERYAAAFRALQITGGEGLRERASEAGRRALSYLVRAGDLEGLSSFVSRLVNTTKDQRTLRRIVDELSASVEQVPAGKTRWVLHANLADALENTSRPDEAIPFFEKAVAEAEQAAQWSHVGAIYQNWASALRSTGRLEEAKAAYQRAAEAHASAGSPLVEVLGSEIEALRINVMQDDAERALPEIEGRLNVLRTWSQQHRLGQSVPQAPDSVVLSRALMGALDVARLANLALERWEECLAFLDEIHETERASGAGEYELARIRFNLYKPLLHLGRFTEAQGVLENCLTVFRDEEDLKGEASALGALADLWEKRGDCEQAVGLARQALAAFNRLGDLEARAISHSNLASYLNLHESPMESVRHRLAAIGYELVMGHEQLLANDLNNLAIDMRRASDRYDLPRLAELLARPDFEPLQRTLTERNVTLDSLQAEIDQHVEEVRRRVEEE